MDLLKTPSFQSLLDSDIESVASLQSLDIEELDEAEYALPPSEAAPTLAEVLNADDDDNCSAERCIQEEPTTCAALQVDLLQAISQQLSHAQERTSAGAGTSLSVGAGGQLAVGTAHGRVLTFQDQVLRWVCDANADRGAVSCLAFNLDGTRILAGYARSLVCQYESSNGAILRRVVLGGDLWGVLQVSWAGATGLALDTGGSVWLMKFSRPLGVRSARTSCLFSGARGEVVAMAARDARVLALATLSRIIVVAGGRAAGVRFGGPSDTLPVLTWSDNDDEILICARAYVMQWLTVDITGAAISLHAIKKVELNSSPLWLGWLGDDLAIFDSNEKLFLWGNNIDKPIDLSNIEPVYASAFFKGVWTDGRVSLGMRAAGVHALGGASVQGGALALLGRRGVVRVRPRDALARASALFSSRRHAMALHVMCSVPATAAPAAALARHFLLHIAERPHLLADKDLAGKTIKLCVVYGFSDELWGLLWEQCSKENNYLEALSDAIARGELDDMAPSPDVTQALIERLSEFAPELVERVVACLPLTALDPHRASVFVRARGLWRAAAALAATLGGCTGAMRELCAHVSTCRAGGGETCACAGDALLLAAADGLAGRGAGGRSLPHHARPSARRDALQALLAPHEGRGALGATPLEVLARHDARGLARLLEQSVRDPPFVGPLGKQNRLRVARALLSCLTQLHAEDKVEILEFISNQLSSGVLPADQEIISGVQESAATVDSLRSDRAWLALLQRSHTRGDLASHLAAAEQRPRVLWRLHCLADKPRLALQHFFLIPSPTEQDVDELFEYVHKILEREDRMTYLKDHLPAVAELRPRAAAAVLAKHCLESTANVLESLSGETALAFAERLLEAGVLSGEAALTYFRCLCRLRPHEVESFLAADAGLVRPEDALAIVREVGPKSAEPWCLEAAGDPDAALDAAIALCGTDPELAESACRLCARAARAAPTAVAAAMWGRLLDRVERVPPAALLDAVAHVPAERLLERRRASARLARALLACARCRRRMWRCAEHVAGRELHEALARSLRAAGGALCVREARCGTCGGALAGVDGAARACPCGTAVHARCAPDARCASCRRSLPPAPPTPHRTHARRSLPPRTHDLYLVAPPRPDLEELV